MVEIHKKVLGKTYTKIRAKYALLDARDQFVVSIKFRLKMHKRTPYKFFKRG